MPEVIANTSPLQYLFQLGLLQLLPDFYGEVAVPVAVAQEIQAGLARGVYLPDISALPWLRISEVRHVALLPLAAGLGAGEREVLALAAERNDSLVILDDGLARRFAERLRLRLTGTIGLLVKAKRASKIEAVRPYLERLERLGFRLDAATRSSILALAGEGTG